MAKRFIFNPEHAVQEILTKIEINFKARRVTMGDIMYHRHGCVAYEIVIETPDMMASEMAEIINGSKHGYVKSYDETDGHYDWGADHYCRPYSSVVFEVKP